jgi:hypothetical protein
VNINVSGVLLTACVAAVISLSGCAPEPTYSETCTSVPESTYDKLSNAYSTCEIDHQYDALAKELGLDELLVPLPEIEDTVLGLGELGTSCVVAVFDRGNDEYRATILSRFDGSLEVVHPVNLSASRFASLMDDYRLADACQQLPTT